MPRIVSYLIFTMVFAAGAGVAESMHDDAMRDSEGAERVLQRTTAVLKRFRDVDVATAEGYVHYDGYDTFAMGEHWYNRDVYELDTCELSKPTHLQYLVIDSRRTLVGTGYVCLPNSRDALTTPLFGDSVVWHTHGPAWCSLPNGSAEDYRDLADALPNDLTDVTWQQVCQQEGGQPGYQDIDMLHTWNWIPHPNGAFQHENLAIPFLRAGLTVPTQEFLDSDDGRAVVETLRLAHGDVHWWYWRAFTVVNADPGQRRRGWRTLVEATRKGKDAVDAMRVAEDDGNRGAYLNSGRDGEAAMLWLGHELDALFSLDQSGVFKDYLASLHRHDKHAGQDH